MGLGLGLGIWWPIQTSIIPGILKPLKVRATYFENVRCTTATLKKIENIQYTAPIVPVGFLASYPGASVAYSLRNLINTTTSVVRVRRSSDNTEQDFTATQITDGTLTTFTGVNDGFVTTWYDQSGNGNNMTQVTALSQPNLVTNGSIVLSNNKPTLLFDQSYLSQSVNLNSSEAEHFLVIEASLYPPTDRLQTGFYQYKSSGGVLSHYGWTDGKIYDGFATSSRKTFTPAETLAKLNLYNVLSKSSEWSARLNSNEAFTTSNNTVDFGTIQRLGSDYTNTFQLKGYISEFMVYPSDQSTNRAGIETNIMPYYETFVAVPFGETSENGNLILRTPPGKVFATVEFASYGNPSGTDGNYTIGSCNASSSQTIVEGYLLGNTGQVIIPATNAVFGDPCSGVSKKLAVKATFS